MTNYQFELIDRTRQDPLPEDARRRLLDRPWVHLETSLKGTAACYRPDAALENAINTAIAVGEPLLLTGEPGTGKTQGRYEATLRELEKAVIDGYAQLAELAEQAAEQAEDEHDTGME